jgi:hypothetical protein
VPVVPAVPVAEVPAAPSPLLATGLLLPQPMAKASSVALERHDRVESQDVDLMEKPPGLGFVGLVLTPRGGRQKILSRLSVPETAENP